MAKKATKKKTTKKTVKKAAKKTAKKTAKKVAKKVAKKTTKKAPMLPPVGALAPSFTLADQDGHQVSLESLRGKNVVVYFYPRAMTPGCTVQACGLRDVRAQLAEKDIVVLGVSADKQSSLKKFVDRDHLNFTLLSDADHRVAKAYGSYGPKQFMGRTFDGILRQSFLIGKDGKLLHVIKKVDTKNHAQEVLDFFSR